MQLKSFLLIFVSTLLYLNNIQAQSSWSKELGIWINVDLNKRLKLNQPFDSTVNIRPRFLWLMNFKELEIENRFEQKRKYSIKKIDSNTIIIDKAIILLRGDTIIMKSRYFDVVKFVKYKE